MSVVNVSDTSKRDFILLYIKKWSEVLFMTFFFAIFVG